MRIVIACENSGVVREAFQSKWGGVHDIWSCDILPSDIPSEKHFQGDIRKFIKDSNWWDMMIAFPPCTRLCVSGARWFDDYKDEQDQGAGFFMRLAGSKIKRIAIENPIGIMSNWWRKPDQIIQPWQFGHGETKATCLWLKNLPKLKPTNIVSGREPKVHFASPGPDRWKERSRTYQGIANAMATQWA